MNITPFSFTWPAIRLYGFTLFFLIAGIAHLVYPRLFMAIIPILPHRKTIVYLTGIMEIIFGIALLFPNVRMITIWLTILYLLAIFPGNIYMALHPERYNFSKISLFLRLPLQFLFIWWVYSLRHIS